MPRQAESDPILAAGSPVDKGATSESEGGVFEILQMVRSGSMALMAMSTSRKNGMGRAMRISSVVAASLLHAPVANGRGSQKPTAQELQGATNSNSKLHAVIRPLILK